MNGRVPAKFSDSQQSFQHKSGSFWCKSGLKLLKLEERVKSSTKRIESFNERLKSQSRKSRFAKAIASPRCRCGKSLHKELKEGSDAGRKI